MRAARRNTDAVQFNKAVVLLGVIFRKPSANIKKRRKKARKIIRL